MYLPNRTENRNRRLLGNKKNRDFWNQKYPLQQYLAGNRRYHFVRRSTERFRRINRRELF